MATPDIASIQELIDTDPEIQAAFAELGSLPLIAPRGGQSRMGYAQRVIAPLLQERGVQMPQDWGISLGEDAPVGQLTERGWWDRNVDWLAPLIVGAAGAAGGAGAAGAFGSGGGAGAGAGGTLAASTPALSAGTLAPTVAPALGAGAGTGAGVGGTLAAATPALVNTAPATVAATGTGGGMAGASSILGNLASNPDTYGMGLSMLGRMGEGMAGERGDENQYGMDLNRALANLFATEQGASSRASESEERGKLDRAELGLKAPDVRTRQSILGSLLQEIQPFTVGDTGRIKVPTISGGLTPAALNADARRTGEILQTQAIDALLSGSDIPEETDFQAARLPAPELNQYRGPGTGESILSGLGAAGNTFLGAQEWARRQAQNPNQVGAPARG